MEPRLSSFDESSKRASFSQIFGSKEGGDDNGCQEESQEGREEGREEGRAQGEAAAVLRVLAKRGIAVDDKSRERIESCTDLDLLGTWLDRSLTAEQVDELFA